MEMNHVGTSNLFSKEPDEIEEIIRRQKLFVVQAVPDNQSSNI